MTTPDGDRRRRMSEWAIAGAAIGTPLAGAAGAALGAVIGVLAAVVRGHKPAERS